LATEQFLEHGTWTRLVKIGDWILDEERSRIIGSGMGAYLLSREEYGDFPFVIQAEVKFSNFQPPSDQELGMNAGIVFGWKVNGNEANRYYNILLTGTELLVERVGFSGGREGQDFEHITEEFSLKIDRATAYLFEVRVGGTEIEIYVDTRRIMSFPRPKGVVGRVGLRPWRSQMDCTRFLVTSSISL
jgi:hypothetical protein